MRTSGLNFEVDDFDVKTLAVWEGSVTIRCETQTKNICSLGFRDRREGVPLRGLIIWSYNVIKVPHGHSMYMGYFLNLARTTPWSL
jgi:hypothetical protein